MGTSTSRRRSRAFRSTSRPRGCSSRATSPRSAPSGKSSSAFAPRACEARALSRASRATRCATTFASSTASRARASPARRARRSGCSRAARSRSSRTRRSARWRFSLLTRARRDAAALPRPLQDRRPRSRDLGRAPRAIGVSLVTYPRYHGAIEQRHRPRRGPRRRRFDESAERGRDDRARGRSRSSLT